MRRSRASLSFALLALLSPWACADTLTVNTTTDDFQANSLCSLREAVEYFNRGRPEGGFQGCVAPGSDSGAVIILPAKATPYRIEGSAITVRTGLALNGDGRSGDGDITHIEVGGRHRAFVINHNPQWVPPGCPGGCASSPAGATAPTFDLAPASDSGTVGDYLTTVSFPDVVGTLPAESAPFVASSYVVRIYRIPAQGNPVEVGRTKVAFAATPMNWTARAALLTTGVFDLGYTLQPVDAGDLPLGAESDLALSPRLRVAVFADPARLAVRFSQMLISGGCQAEAAIDCATAVDDDTVVVNDPAAAGSYDATSLSYRNGLTLTAGRGGVIYSNERLVLSDVLVRYGQANDRGGAIYLTADGGLNMDESELRENRAVRGAAVFSEANAVMLSTSLLTANDVVAMTGPGGLPVADPAGPGAVLEIASATVPNELDASVVSNTTLSGNGGRALSLRAGARVSSATIVLNSGGGIDFNGENVGVHATILANNAGDDCRALPGTVDMDYSLVLAAAAGGTCPATGNRTITDTPDSPDQLMAGLVDGKCAGPWGLLCPLADEGGSTFVHLPRVLEYYLDVPAGLGASYIINQAAGSTHCSSIDQRGEPRIAGGCDIGAVEVQALRGGSAPTGGVIAYGQIYTQAISMDLGDEDLLTAARCEQLFPPQFDADGRRFPPASLAPDPSRVVADSYRVRNPANPADTVTTAAGCPWVEKAPTRGRVTFSVEGDYTYAPTSTFHGFDRFDFRVVTTLSALNVLPADRSRLMKGMVIVEPSVPMTSDKLGGAPDLWTLLLLAIAGLGWRRGGKA